MIAQGEDKIINVTVYSTYTNASGRKTTTPLNLTPFAGYIIYLYSEETNVLIDKFSKIAATGYTTIDVIDAATGRLALWLDKSKTTAAPIGQVYGELKTSLDDTDFTLDKYYTVSKFPVDKIVYSVTNTINPPE